jgi:tetratricopeptide (TPR) repeat protein
MFDLQSPNNTAMSRGRPKSGVTRAIAQRTQTVRGGRGLGTNVEQLRRRRRLNFLYAQCASIAVFAFLVFIPSLQLGFIHDDHSQIENNYQIQSWDFLGRLITTHVWSQATVHTAHFYRPLFSVWMLVLCSVGGQSTEIWHGASICLHVVAVCILFILAREVISTSGALACAAIFAAYPTHVDAVSWVSASDELLFAIFFLMCLIFLIRAIQANKHSSRLYVSSLALYAAALLSKETSVALLPLILLVLFLWSRPHVPKAPTQAGTIWFFAMYVFITAVYFLMRGMVLHGIGIEMGKTSWRNVFFTSPWVFLFYLKKLILPLKLSFFYMNPIFSGFTWSFWSGCAVILGMLYLIFLLAYKGHKIEALALALVLLPIFPALSGIRIYEQGNMTHDRYLYLSSVGVCLLIGTAAHNCSRKWTKARIPMALMMISVCFYFVYLTILQQRYYKDDETSFLRALEVAPDNALVMESLGKIYLGRSETDKALNWFRKADQTAPKNANMKLQYARGLSLLGHFEEAIASLDEVATDKFLSSREHELALLYLANVKLQQGDLNESEQILRRLQQLNTKFYGLHRSLGTVLQKEKKLSEAQSEYAKEFEITGDEESERQSVAIERFLLLHRSVPGFESSAFGAPNPLPASPQ